MPTIKLLPVLGRDDNFIRGANNVDIISCGIDVKECNNSYVYDCKYSYEQGRYFDAA